MKLSTSTVFAALSATTTVAVATPAAFVSSVATKRFGDVSLRRTTTAVNSFRPDNFDLSGNTWKPTEGRMHSTDTGDYAPTNAEDVAMMQELEFTDGIYGSQIANADKMEEGPAIPGLENLGEDAIMMGGIERPEGVPADMEFIPSSVPDGHIEFQCSSTNISPPHVHEIRPFCMGFEDYYAAFTNDSSPVFRISPGTAVGRMDRRGGESTFLEISADPKGQGGRFEGTLVVNLPDDGSKLTYTVLAISL